MGIREMLRGRESLIRVVGKRRRLSLHEVVQQSQFETLKEAPTTDEIASESFAYRHGSDIKLADSEQLASTKAPGEDATTQWVNCPVCGKHIKAHYINNHLDFCLLGEVKGRNNQLRISNFCFVGAVGLAKDINHTDLEKEKQQSLLEHTEIATDTCSVQSNFSSEMVDTESAVQGTDANASESIEMILYANEDKVENSLDKNLAFNLNGSKLEGLSRENGSHIFTEFEETKPPIDTICDCSCHMVISSEIMDKREEDRENKGTESNLIAAPQNLLHNDIEHGELDSWFSLETKIVGRKFNQDAKVEKGLKVAILREPDNPKDSNAIKIVPAEDEKAITLGHLPRELAFHLSYLLDSGMLQVQGSIVAVPETVLDAVPLKLLCKRRNLIGTAEVEEFENCWKQMLHVTERMEENQALDCFSAEPRYQRNFRYLLQAVLERDSHLLSEEEIAFLGSFSLLSGDAQRLFIRLYQRKGPWFRVSDISYSDISNPTLASQELLVAGYLTAADENKIMDTLEILTVPELKQLILKGRLMKKAEIATTKKNGLVKCIISASKEKQYNTARECCNEPGISSLVMDAIGACICISSLAAFLFWRLQRLFFLNGDQNLSAFLLVDIGRIKYPTYSCKRTQCVFSSRKDLLAFEKALEIAQAMDMALEENDHNSVLQLVERACVQLIDTTDGFDNRDMFLVRFSSTWVCATIVTVGVSVLERDHKYAEAVTLLKQLLSQSCPGRRGYWTIRLSIDLEHLGHKGESLEVAETGLKDSRIRTGDRIALQRRVVRLSKPPRRWKKPLFADAMTRKYKEVCLRGRPLNRVVGVKSRFYGYDGQQCSVEELALQFYAKEENGCWEGIHSEGGIWMTLFGLLMWDILFADVSNVFLTPFQSAPLDLETDAFYPSREAAIETQLSRIHNGEGCQMLAGVWVKWYGTLCRGVNWERHSLAELQVIASCIGGPGLASVCRLLAEDYVGWTGGMPDLLLWRTKPRHYGKSNVCINCYCQGNTLASENFDSILPRMRSVEGEAKLVEVKGPRDKLSEQQHAWILILMDAGICVEVCKVYE